MTLAQQIDLIARHLPEHAHDASKLAFEARQVLARIDCGSERREKFVFFDVVRSIIAMHQREPKIVKTGVCPVCEGSCILPSGKECNNCGGQTMSGRPTGKVPLRPDGTPCTHKYESFSSGRCLTTYVCSLCGHRYDIDSGD
jgi:hypothetical protein